MPCHKDNFKIKVNFRKKKLINKHLSPQKIIENRWVNENKIEQTRTLGLIYSALENY